MKMGPVHKAAMPEGPTSCYLDLWKPHTVQSCAKFWDLMLASVLPTSHMYLRERGVKGQKNPDLNSNSVPGGLCDTANSVTSLSPGSLFQ